VKCADIHAKGTTKRKSIMGMAASQARLLTITARLHDVEYQAQSIQNAKIALATQEDQVYKDFLDATSATTLIAKDYQGNMITATFNTICGVDSTELVVPHSKNGRYVLLDDKGRLIVPDEIKEAFDDFMNSDGFDNKNDPYAFALFAMGFADDKYDVDDVKESSYELIEDTSSLDKLQSKIDNFKEDIGYDEDGDNEDISDDDLAKLQTLQDEYNFRLFSSNFNDVYDYLVGGEPADKDQAEFNYYVRVFQEIKQANGCVAISDFDGIDGIGDAANDSEWLKQMISCGKIIVDVSEKDSKTGNVSFKATTVASDSGLEEVATTTIDKTAYAKAEAEYEHKRKQLDQKDKRFDMDLSKLETERTALTTEYDSVKKVIEDNIERTFGIFS